MSRTIEFSRPCLILCEGPEDKAVIHQLIKLHSNLHGKFCVRHAGDAGGTGCAGGKSKFANSLKNTAITSPTFRRNVRRVIIVVDADESRTVAFSGVCKSLSEHGIAIPAQIGEFVQHEEYDLAIYVIPETGTGCLESICYPAMSAKWHLETALEEFFEKTPAREWPSSASAKAKLHVLMSVTCRTKPATSLQHIWQESSEYHIPLDGGAFAALVAFMSSSSDAYNPVLEDND